jgi:hypothetical protein
MKRSKARVPARLIQNNQPAAHRDVILSPLLFDYSFRAPAG